MNLLKGLLVYISKNGTVTSMLKGKTNETTIENSELIDITNDGNDFLVLSKNLKKNNKLCVTKLEKDLKLANNKENCFPDLDGIENVTRLRGGFALHGNKNYQILSDSEYQILSKKDYEVVTPIKESNFVIARSNKNYDVFSVDRKIKKIASLNRNEYDCNMAKTLIKMDANHGIICVNLNFSKNNDLFLEYFDLGNLSDENQKGLKGKRLILLQKPNVRHVDNVWMFESSQAQQYEFI